MGKSSFTLTTLPFLQTKRFSCPRFASSMLLACVLQAKRSSFEGIGTCGRGGGVSIRVEREVCRGKQSREAQGLCTAPQADAFGSGVGARREAQDLRTAPQAGVPDAEQMAGGKPNSEWRGAGGEQLANRRWGRAASEREAERWGAAAGKRERRIGEGIAFAGRGGRIGMASGFRRIRVGKRRNPNVSRERCGR